MEECQRLLDLLGIYEATFGQAINRPKTSLFFSTNTKPEVRRAIQQIVKKYLELPMVSGKSKVNTFKDGASRKNH